MAKKKRNTPPPIELEDSTRIEARLSPLLETALKTYMRDNHLENRSEVLKSALGQFLEQKGYLARTTAEEPGDYKVTIPVSQ